MEGLRCQRDRLGGVLPLKDVYSPGRSLLEGILAILNPKDHYREGVEGTRFHSCNMEGWHQDHQSCRVYGTKVHRSLPSLDSRNHQSYQIDRRRRRHQGPQHQGPGRHRRQAFQHSSLDLRLHQDSRGPGHDLHHRRNPQGLGLDLHNRQELQHCGHGRHHRRVSQDPGLGHYYRKQAEKGRRYDGTWLLKRRQITASSGARLYRLRINTMSW